MIDDATHQEIAEAAQGVFVMAEAIASASEEERRLLQAEIAKAATGQPARSNLFALSTLLSYAWRDALWRRD